MEIITSILRDFQESQREFVLSQRGRKQESEKLMGFLSGSQLPKTAKM